jgi:hypothetical protein
MDEFEDIWALFVEFSLHYGDLLQRAKGRLEFSSNWYTQGDDNGGI